MKELNETVGCMLSPDYKDRFKAEYYQLKIRYDKLVNMCKLWDEGKLSFTPTCPRSLYYDQLEGMEIYLAVLEERAKLEDIVLEV